MSENNKINDNDEGREKLSGARTRAPAPEWPEYDRDSVSVSKATDSDGSTITRVIHPPMKLKNPGQIKEAYEAGEIDLNTLVGNVTAGLNAEQAVITTDTVGSGKDRVTTQKVIMVPDHAMRLKWQDHITNTVEGMAVKRQEIISRRITTEEDLIKQATQSPAMRKALLKQLEKIESEASNKRGSEKATPEPASKEAW